MWYCLREVEYYFGDKCWGNVIQCSKDKEELETLKTLLKENGFLRDIEVVKLVSKENTDEKE